MVGTMVVAPHQTLPRISTMYRRDARWYDATRWTFLVGRARAVRECALSTGDTALEIGCGTGSNLARLARAAGSSGHVVGFDYVAEMLAQAAPKAARLTAKGYAVTLRQGDASSLDLPPGLVPNAVLFSYSLSMIPQWRAALDRAYAVLAPGGRCVVVDFHDMQRWPGLLRRAVRSRLAQCGVDPDRDVHAELAARFGADAVGERHYRGRYARVVWATKSR